MGLSISKQMRVLGIDTTGIYLRMKIDHYFTGILDVYVNAYINKEAYVENINNNFQVDGIQRHYQFPYDRDVDGVDILQFVHNKIINELTVDETIDQEVTDIDGKKTIEKVVVKEKFVSVENINTDLNNTKNG